MPLVGWRAERVRAFLALSDVAEQMALLEDASRHAPLPRRLRRADVSLHLARRVRAAVPFVSCRQNSAPCFGNGWKEDLPGIKTPRIPMRGRSCSAKPATSLSPGRGTSGSSRQMRHPGWNHVLPGSLTPLRCRTFWMAQSRLTVRGSREPSVARPPKRPSSSCEALPNRPRASAPTRPSAIARCCGESWTSGACRHSSEAF